jgi:hypothetical protein
MQGAPRSISPEKRAQLLKQLKPMPGREFIIMIRAPNHTPESQKYAEQLKSLFSDAGWQTGPVFYNMIMGATGSDPSGLIAIVHDRQRVAGLSISKAFGDAGIQVEFGMDQSLAPDALGLIVGQKPPN